MACFALLLAGCVTTAPTPSAHVTPAPEPAATPASVLGYEEPSTMLDNFTVHVAAIDGIPVTAGREGWNTAVSLKPGSRRLTLTFTRGVFSAQAEVTIAAASGASYQARFATDAQLFGRNSYCEFWLVDTATNEPVTTRIRVPLKRIEAGKDAP